MSAEGFAKLRERCEALFPAKKYRDVESPVKGTKKRYFYGQSPQRLLTSREVSFPARTIFGILHCLSSKKDLATQPVVQVSLKELCRAVGRGETLVRQWLKELEKAGWIDILHRGVHKENRYRLYESSLADRQGPEHLEAVKRKLRDPAVIKRLTPKT